MNGVSVGKLKLYQVLENDEILTKEKLLVTITGNQGTEWHQAYIRIRPLNSSYQLVFQATRGPSYLGDIALDKFSFCQDMTNCKLLKEKIEENYIPLKKGIKNICGNSVY